jgi:hypothetical protein
MADDKKQPDSASELDQNNEDIAFADAKNDVSGQKNADIYDDEGRIRSDFRKSVAASLDASDVDALNHFVEGLHESELGDLTNRSNLSAGKNLLNFWVILLILPH